MKPFLLVLILAILFSAYGCARPPVDQPAVAEPPAAIAEPPITEPAAASESTTAPTEMTTAPTEPVYVYESAVEDFLVPFESCSWERQYPPEFIMIHFTSAVVNHRDDPYNLEYIRDIFVDYNISVHYLIQRDGSIRCYIPENRVAWHAGVGTYLDDPKYTNTMNQFAIGIELLAIGSEADMELYLTPREYRELDDSLKGFTEAQYVALSALIADLCRRYDIPRDSTHIIGHETYSPDKTDPGELFDWSRILDETE